MDNDNIGCVKCMNGYNGYVKNYLQYGYIDICTKMQDCS